MSDDWQLAQGTVDFRNEERRASHRGPVPLRPKVATICPNCLIELDEAFFCSMCGRLETKT